MNEIIISGFNQWLEGLLSANLPNNIVAFNFNLYEGQDEFHIQLIGADNYDENDEEWACDEVYTSGEDIYVLEFKDSENNWQAGLEEAKILINNFLSTNDKSVKLKAAKAVAVGFVDGNLEVLYKK